MKLAMRKCLGCGGVYPPVQRDGYSYYHVCPPLRGPKGEDAGPRPGHRDENLVHDSAGKLVGIVAEGAGSEPVK